MRKLHHITRLDYVYGAKESHGWWVRIQRLVDGKRKTFGKTFYDAKYGGKAKALAAAIIWRDENLPKHPVVRNGARSGRRHAPVGHSIFWEYESDRYHALCANVKIADGERPLQARYSIREHGRKGALAMMRRWYLSIKQQLRQEGTLASDAMLKAYWGRLKSVRPKAQRLPWEA